MPMGPIELADTVGLDICKSVALILSTALGMALPDNLDTMTKANLLGKKNGEGFYKYRNGKAVKNKNVHSDNIQQVQDRLILRLLNEAVACLREGIVEDSELIDAGVIFGTGFAPFTGGPLNYIKQHNKENLQATMATLENRFGEKFKLDAGWELV